MMKHFLTLTSHDDLNEIVFEKRNKEYGAYVLRTEESKILKKSLFLGVSAFVILAITPLIVKSFQSQPVVVIPNDSDHTLVNIDPVKTPPVKDIVKITKPKPQASINTAVPEPAVNPAQEKPAVSVKEYDNAKVGLVDREGEKPVHQFNPTPTAGAPTTKPQEVPKKIENPNAIESKVDVQAMFKGGIEKFRKDVGENFDTSVFEGSGDKITANVTFVVEKNGSISNVKAVGKDAYFNKEAEKAVKSVKGIWLPAKLNGELVRSYFNVPITIQFE